MDKLFKNRYLVAILMLIYSILTLFVEHLVFQRFPATDLVSIFVYLYFLFSICQTIVLIFIFSRFVKRYSISANAEGADDLSK